VGRFSLRAAARRGDAPRVAGMDPVPPPPASGPRPGPRRSACAERSRALELERVRRLSVRERIVAALTLGDRYSWLRPGPPAPRE
jgi:hypothetical protein